MSSVSRSSHGLVLLVVGLVGGWRLRMRYILCTFAVAVLNVAVMALWSDLYFCTSILLKSIAIFLLDVRM